MAKHKFFNSFKENLKRVDDADLGRELKKMMTYFRDPSGNRSAHICLAAKMLVFCAYSLRGDKLYDDVHGLEIGGKVVGNYRVTVERIEK